MRTLFLLGIMAALVIIAVKKPDQTAWDAARELGGKAKHVLSEAKDPVVNVAPLEPLMDSLDRAKMAVKAAPSLKPAPPRLPERSAAVREISRSQSPGPRSSPVPLNDQILEKPEVAKDPIVDWSEIPAIPVTPHPIQSPKLPPSDVADVPASKPRTDYADVKIYYENASRLLDEIK
jgi:hypothetical protein